VGSTFHNGRNLNFTFSFIKKLRIPKSLVWSKCVIEYQQSIVKVL